MAESAAGEVDFFERLLPQSQMAYDMAKLIRRGRGLEGWMVVYLPPEPDSPVEVMTSTHGWTMSMDPSSFSPKRKKAS